MLVVISLLTLPVIFADYETPTATFNLGNVAPTQPSTLGVQDTSSATTADTSTPDTHMIYSDLFNISWTRSTDANYDTVYYRFCVASSAANRNNEVCDVINKMSNANALATNYYVTTGGDTLLTYDGASKTYYVRVIATDKQGTDENSTAYDSSFAILNSQPSCAGIAFTPAEVHGDLSPNLNWDDCTDADDGTADHYPADVLVYDLKMGDASYGDTERLNKDNLASSEYTGVWGADLVYGSSESSGMVNKTFYTRITADDQQGASNSVSGNVDKDLVLYDHLPDVTAVQVTSAGSAYTNMALQPIEHGNATVAVRVQFTDLDSDCSSGSGHITYIHFCLNATPGETCDHTTNTQVWQVDSQGGAGTACEFVFTTNKTGVTGWPQFWKAPSNYKVYANVTESGTYGPAGIIRSSDTERATTWTYNSLQGINYPTSINLGTLTMGQWNNGTTEYQMVNWGNVIMDVLWNSSDFQDGGDQTHIDTMTEFQIDDDNIAGEGSETGLTPFTLNTTSITTSKEFQPTNGLIRCDSNACNNANAYLGTYWHINLETGLVGATYTATIRLETEAHD